MTTPTKPTAKLTSVPWNWRNFGCSWMLTTRRGGSVVILCAMRKGKTGVALSVRDENGTLSELTPDHPVAQALEAVPELIAVAQMAYRNATPGSNLSITAREALFKAGLTESELCGEEQ